MTLKLYAHPLSAFCWKALIALYETGLPFESELVDFGDSASRERFLALWPMGRFPVLQDTSRDLLIPEASQIVEYVDQLMGGDGFVPDDRDRAREVRFWDRFYDLYVAQPMQKAITDSIRPEPQRDRLGVQDAERQIRTAYDIAEAAMKHRTWAAGDSFTMADCAAAPALYYADWIIPFGRSHPALAGYLGRLKTRPSFARALEEAGPYLHMVPRGRTAVPA
jgi:glutathione S-transferase